MIKCDYCGKPAVRNYQKVWISWEVDSKKEGYSKEPRLEFDIEEAVDDENIHVCEDHEDQWLDNEL